MKLEQLLFGQRPSVGVSDLDGVVTSTSPYMVRCTGDDEPSEVTPLVREASVGERVMVLSVGRHRYAIPYGGGSLPSAT